MAKSVKTYLFCYDYHRSFSEEVKKRFSDQTRYTVMVFHNLDDFVNQLISKAEQNYCKVALIGMQDTGEDLDTVDQLTPEIKRIDRLVNIIIVGPPDKMEDIRKRIKLNVTSYIPLNANLILRIHNTVKKLLSEHSLAIYRRRRNFSLYVLFAFIAVAISLIVISYFRFPEYF